MNFRSVLACALALMTTACLADDYELNSTEKAPEGLSPAIEKLLEPAGAQISGANGPVVELWLLKSVATEPGFKSSLSKLYPFKPGQLVGALHVAKGAKYTDFRGQQVAPGVYTLRYGLQPVDGNHVGTSETSDFLLALPARADTGTEPIATFDELAQLSAKAAGSTHPAILSLLEPPRTGKSTKLEENSGNEHWTLTFATKGSAEGKETTLRIKLVVIGQFEG